MTGNWRLNLISFFFALTGILLIGRLFYWQVLAGDELAVLAQTQQQSTIELPARRGQIFTSDNNYLVTNKPAYFSYLIRGKSTFNPDLSQKLAPILADSLSFSATPSAKIKETEAILNERLNNDRLIWIPLSRKLALTQKTALESLGLGDQLFFEDESVRLYPEASMAAHLLGFVGDNSEGKELGQYGLEGYYQTELAGRPGILKQEKDALNQPILTGDWQQQEKKDGRDLKLNLNRGLQFLVEKKLQRALQVYGAKAGSVAVMDPYSGAILAMASLPGYDPGTFYRYDPQMYLNPVIAQAFEPGSIFKIFVMASALDAGAIKPETICDICSGPVKIDKYFINTWDNKYYPNSSMTDILVHSDNVGMVFIGQKLGLPKFLEYFKKFGFSEKTGIDLQDEATPDPKSDKNWTYVDLATASFGQGFLATGMQLLQGVAAIANGGQLVQPRVVDKVLSSDREINVATKVKRRIISPETAKLVTQMMIAAAESGEAKWTNVKGYQIAGKTGTAQVAVGGKYATNATNASFIGFAPADNPKFVMLVTLKDPSSSQWASETAAPLWFSLAQDLLNHFNILPETQ
ncbi:MAG: penicillin-binding protein 2 [Candidatus Beckwithbacteria bacterium]|nr:penicillin-binding protein 2 [Candidatus Beckwithbacteria bacterium]